MNFKGIEFSPNLKQSLRQAALLADLLSQVKLLLIDPSYVSVTLWLPDLCWGIISLDFFPQFIPSIYTPFSVPWTTIKVGSISSPGTI